MKKGQTEIIGFMVIVLLLFFALLFYFRFSSDSSSSSLLIETEENLEVSNLLSVMKQYTVCKDHSLGDAIKACAEGGDIVCGENACTLVRREVAQVVELNGWKENEYMFFIGEELYSPSSCIGNTFVDSYTTGGVEIRLAYCSFRVDS